MPGAKSILGIDLRVASVKVVEVEKEAVVKSAMTEIPIEILHNHPQVEDAKGEALRGLIQTHNIKAREAVVVVGGSDTLIKLFTLSALPPHEVAEAIKWKFAEEMPFPVEDALIDFYPLPHTSASSEKIDYIAACINRKLFLETKYVLNKAGIKLIGITPVPEALHKLFHQETDDSGSKISSIIYMGNRTTNISIYRHGNFEFNRELNIGGENITQAMTGVLVSAEGKVEITAERAEKIKVEYGLPINLDNYPQIEGLPLGQLQAMVRPALEKIQSEIIRTFEYYKSQTGEAAVGKLVFTGGGSQTKNLKEFLAEGLGIPVISPELPFQLDLRLAGALGAALVGIQGLNLMPEEEKYPVKNIMRKLMEPQLLVPIFVGALAFIYLIFWLRGFALENKLDSINRKLEESKPRLAQLQAIEQKSQQDMQREATLKAYEGKRLVFPKVFENISRLIPESAYIDSMNLTPTSLRLSGTVFKRGDAAENILSYFVLALSATSLFDDVQLVQAVKNNDYSAEAFKFEIIALIKGD